MSAIQNLHSFDPFVDASKGDDLLPACSKDYTHRSSPQRDCRETLIPAPEVADDLCKKKLGKVLKKKVACNGTVIQRVEYADIIQLQDKQRKNRCQS